MYRAIILSIILCASSCQVCAAQVNPIYDSRNVYRGHYSVNKYNGRISFYSQRNVYQGTWVPGINNNYSRYDNLNRYQGTIRVKK